MNKKITILLAMLAMAVIALAGCKNSKQTDQVAKSEEKILRTCQSFALETLDPHLDYQGWYTSIYGMTETLFKMNNQSSFDPLIAESASNNGNTWTIKIKNQAVFSNGNSITSDMVIRNLKDAGERNPRFAYLTDYDYQVVNDKVFTITTREVYPTLMNELASPELAIVDLDNSGDMSSNLVASGPFVVSSFEPGGTVKVSKNQQYWNGDVKLDGAVFYYMPEPDTSLMAMQNGEIDSYTSVTKDAAEIYQKNSDTYQLVAIPATRLQFYILNETRLDESVRKAINRSVDSKAIEEYLDGTVTSTIGPFAENTAYGKVTKDKYDIQAAKKILEKDGYLLNADGYYEKDGKVLTLNIAYYAARSLDTLATLMQEQLKEVGIKCTLTCEENPDGTYIATGDFDIALYCMIADKAGDPYYFISCTLAKDAPYNCGGFSNEKEQSMIEELKLETDSQKRADLANQIVQTAIDEEAFGYVALFNKITVMQNGVRNVAENCPFDFYFLNADTDMD
jgi:peptide/nickel transport system substrate-binding protein